MEQDCLRFQELRETLGDKCKPYSRSLQTGQSSKDLFGSNQSLPTVSNTSEATDILLVSTSSVRHVVPEPSKSRRKGKGKSISEVVLGDIPQRSPVQIVAENYLGSSLSIQKKEAKARLMIEHVEKPAEDIGEDPAETDRKLKEVIDNTVGEKTVPFVQIILTFTQYIAKTQEENTSNTAFDRTANRSYSNI
ncbi:uncharacterized protein ATC70_001499 [Mucor velutinosus]|uniref:Uncharacterized protein n=1 Tax=Mucor velutinosus TaxID=708070 RepID=A0AAN7DJG3_9FUNG|nr:hypothetical protein ATC70_001499 [Mucor velutinosus]